MTIGYFQAQEMLKYGLTFEQYEEAAKLLSETTTLSHQRVLTLSRLYNECVIGKRPGFRQELNAFLDGDRGQRLKMKAVEDLIKKKLVKKTSDEVYTYTLTQRGIAYIEKNVEIINEDLLKHNKNWEDIVKRVKGD